MAQPKTRDQYQILYNEKSERLRKLMTIQKANFSGTGVGDTYIQEIKELDLDLGKIGAALEALETVTNLDETLPQIEDRRSQVSNEQRLHIMVATIQATVGEVANIKRFVTDELKKIDHKLTYFMIVLALVLVALFSVILVR